MFLFDSQYLVYVKSYQKVIFLLLLNTRSPITNDLVYMLIKHNNKSITSNVIIRIFLAFYSLINFISTSINESIYLVCLYLIYQMDQIYKLTSKRMHLLLSWNK